MRKESSERAQESPQEGSVGLVRSPCPVFPGVQHSSQHVVDTWWVFMNTGRKVCVDHVVFDWTLDWMGSLWSFLEFVVFPCAPCFWSFVCPKEWKWRVLVSMFDASEKYENNGGEEVGRGTVCCLSPLAWEKPGLLAAPSELWASGGYNSFTLSPKGMTGAFLGPRDIRLAYYSWNKLSDPCHFPGKEVGTPQFLAKLQIQPIVSVYVLETGTTLA